MNLNEIKNPDFLKSLSIKELNSLCDEIRQFILENVSSSGGHLSSNLGVIELTVAMHYVFNAPKDKLLFDVGHQCYTHKILTGRAKEFEKLRKYDGLSGFINKKESPYDVWESGHSSTSISAQCGYLLSQDILADEKVVVLIGDASIANGVSFEALNYMGDLKNVKPIIIINDNKMSISSNVGATSRSLSKLRSTSFYQGMNNFFAKITPMWLRKICHGIKSSIKGLILKENLFEDWGYDYMGPYDGNDLKVCIKTLKAAKKLNKPCVIHFVSKKGKGYDFAENDDEGIYHSVQPFELKKGIIQKEEDNNYSFAKIFAKKFELLNEKSPHYVIVPAMLQGCEMVKLQQMYPKNILDVGIAEEHAAVMASAMAQNNKKVFLMYYSTFSQRAYDFILNDIARTNAHVVIGIDRADIVSGDGSTHQGIYDVSMFNMMPNIQVVAPKDGDELLSLIDYADNISSPIVIRYSKGNTSLKSFYDGEVITKPSWTIENKGDDIIIITYGENVDYIKNIAINNKISAMIVNARFIKPLDEELLLSLIKLNKPFLIYENCVLNGSLFSSISRFFIEKEMSNIKIKAMGFNSDDIIPTGDIESIRKLFGLDENNILKNIQDLIQKL